jgi:hypothetical protein
MTEATLERAASPVTAGRRQSTTAGGGRHFKSLQLRSGDGRAAKLMPPRIAAGGSVEKITACKSCGGPVHNGSGRGRPPDYCSPDCRRAKEYERRDWERRRGWVEAAERQAEWDILTPKQREHWRQVAERARARLGPRP